MQIFHFWWSREQWIVASGELKAKDKASHHREKIIAASWKDKYLSFMANSSVKTDGQWSLRIFFC